MNVLSTLIFCKVIVIDEASLSLADLAHDEE